VGWKVPLPRFSNLAKSRGVLYPECQAASTFSIGSITRRSGNLMRLISVSVGSIEPAAGKHVYNHASWDKAGFAKRSSLHFLRSICERQWFTALDSLIIHVKLANTNYPLPSVRKRSKVRHWQEERLGAIRHLSITDWKTLRAKSILGLRDATPKSHPRILFFPFPKSNKYSISFSARSVAPCRSIHCLWVHSHLLCSSRARSGPKNGVGTFKDTDDPRSALHHDQ